MSINRCQSHTSAENILRKQFSSLLLWLLQCLQFIAAVNVVSYKHTTGVHFVSEDISLASQAHPAPPTNFKSKALFFMCKTCIRTVKDSAKNAPKVAIWGAKSKNFSGEGLSPQAPPPVGRGSGEGDTSSPHPTPLGAFGASIRAP